MIKSPFRYFVLLANMRTGSNLFENTVSLYDDIASYGELFNPSFVGTPKKPTLGVSLHERDNDPIAVVEGIIKQHPTAMPGFRLFQDHNKQVLDYVLADKTCAKIILRRNPLDSFVSHQIAKKTDQWQLRDLAVRRTAQITFDIDKFQMYLEKMKRHEAMIEQVIRETGQAAFQIKYDQMARIETFNGVASYLGVDQRITEFATTTKRQNPAGMRDKVTNYDEMQAGLRELNHFETDADPYVEPSKTRGSVSIHAGRTVPIMYFPLGNDYSDPVLDWMRDMELDNQPAQTKMKGREVLNWLSEKSDRVIFTCLVSPIERAYRAFNNRIVFIDPEKNKWIRRILIGQYDLDLPAWPEGRTPNAEDLANANYTPAQHSQNFEKFLDFVYGNLRGQTRAPIDQQWCSQNAAIAGYARWSVPNFVIPPHQREMMFAIIQQQLAIKPAGKSQRVVQSELIALADVYNAKIETKARKAYAEDYQKFGFQNWKPEI
jgi:LPS sulfotransferase NodH